MLTIQPFARASACCAHFTKPGSFVPVLAILLLACHHDGLPPDDTDVTHPIDTDVARDTDDTDPAVDTDAADTDTVDTDTVPEDRWRPTVGTSWQIQYSGALDTTLDVAMYDLDLFDTPASTFQALQDRGVKVVCYFSAGSYEDWRPDADDFPPEALGDPLDGWPGEWWLDVRNADVRTIMQARMDLAVDKGCDAIDPDNVDGYQNANGVGLVAADQLDYNAFLATEAHARGLAVGLKNDLGQVGRLAADFDFAVNEECVQYDECDRLSAFTDANKPVFHIEYVDRWADADAQATAVCGVGPQLDTLIKTWDLDARRLACP
jgi:hypothetical protein